MVIPAGTYPDQLFQANKRKYDPKRLEQQRAKAAEEFFTRDVKTPEAPPGKQNIDIQTDQFVAELTDKAPVYEIGCQTEFKIERPPTPHKMPKIAGVTKKTLTEDNELFLFEDEVEPILSVLCGKTLEVARMEVLQEEELAEMKRQQDSFANMRKNEEAEIKKMEDAEKKRLEAYEAKKSLERSRREAKKIAHKKVVSRVLGKRFNSNLKVCALTFLRDVGMFRNTFEQDVLDADVMPWLIMETQRRVEEMGSHNSYPNTLINNFVSTKSDLHTNKVKEYAEMIAQRRADEKKAVEDKIAAKKQRKEERAAKKKAEEIAKLREEIKEKFVDKAAPVDEILKQEITEVDGWSQDGKAVVTALGGFLGQFMIVLNTVAKYYPQLDRPVKTGKSGNRASDRPKSRASNKSGGDKSQKSARSAKDDALSEIPRQILNPQVVQNFIYTYILEKQKTEKFSMQCDARFEKFLTTLPQPIQLNEMRSMKEEKYDYMRGVLDKFLGSPILRLIKDNQDKLDMDPEVFDLIYNGFWDLYTLKPKMRDVSARKLQAWIQKIKLSSGPDRMAAEEEPAAGDDPAGDGDGDGDGDGSEKPAAAEESKGDRIMDGEDIIDPIAAVVRLKIPKVPKEPEVDEDGNEVVVEIDESELDDIPFEDRCLAMASKIEDQQIWVINHLANKTVRQEISAEFRGSAERLDNLDT